MKPAKQQSFWQSALFKIGVLLLVLAACAWLGLTITTAREQALTPGEKNLGVAVLGMICSGDCRCWRSVQPVCVSCWCIQWCFSTGDFVQADLCIRLADVSPFHLSASAWPMGIGPFSDLLEDRCGPVVGCLRSAGLRTLRKGVRRDQNVGLLAQQYRDPIGHH